MDLLILSITLSLDHYSHNFLFEINNRMADGSSIHWFIPHMSEADPGWSQELGNLGVPCEFKSPSFWVISTAFPGIFVWYSEISRCFSTSAAFPTGPILTILFNNATHFPTPNQVLLTSLTLLYFFPTVLTIFLHSTHLIYYIYILFPSGLHIS